MTMGYEITHENEQYVRQVVGRGEYDDPSAVVNEALRLMKTREQRLAALRDQIHEGIRSGDSIPAEQVFAKLEQQAVTRRIVDR